MSLKRGSSSDEESDGVDWNHEATQYSHNNDDDRRTFQQLPDEVKKKFFMLRAKNEIIQRSFALLPESERVIQNYFCHYGSHYGKMYITANYVLFIHEEEKLSIPFYKIQSITREKSGLFNLFNTAITIQEMNGPNYFFSNFFHCEECFHILNYLLKNPLTLFSVQKRKKKAESPNNNTNHQNIVDKSKEINEKPTFMDRASERISMVISSIKDNDNEEKYEKPDLQITENCNQIADEIFMIGVNTRMALQNQAEAIDRIERSVDETKQNLNKAQREIDGIKSVGGQIVGKVGSLFDKDLGAYEAPDRNAGDQEREIFYDVPILVKHKNCSLQPAILKFGKSQLLCIDPTAPLNHPKSQNFGNNQFLIINDYQYYYHEISSVVVRIRPLHLDIRFINRDRFRCMSSFLQSIVNEVFLRTKKQVNIRFEFGVPRFQFGFEEMRNYSLKSTREEDHFEFEIVQPKPNVTDDIIINAPSEIKDSLDYQDNQINELHHRISNISLNADDIGKESKRQIDQLSNVHKKLDSATIQAHHENYQVSKLL